MSIDLTEVVQAAARAWYDAGRPEDTAPYDEVSAGAQYRVAESLLPAITAAAPLIEAAVREQVISILEAQSARVAKMRPKVCDEADEGYCHTDGQRSALDFAVRVLRGERP